ncbi:MAG: beta-lactamase family protein [Bryobacterales bacterium]|nr:beta-lactamase family protein [Bryobacterales bacterium]
MPMMLTRRTLIQCLPATLALPGLASGAAIDEALERRVERIIVSEMARRRIPGMSVAVGVGDSPVWTKGYGFASLELNAPTTELSLYRTASIAKPITAVAMLRLVEAGKARLDDEVRQHYPAFPQKQWPITLRQLLGNLSGIRGYQGDESSSAKHYPNVADGLEMFANDPLAHKPGTKYLYSTYGFNLAGAVAERIAGMPFRRLLGTSIFEPAGMRQTRDDHHFAVIPNRVDGYRKNGNHEIENCVLADTSNKVPGGGLLSTAGDLVRFGRAILDGKLVNKVSQQEMWTSQRTVDGKTTGYGLGWLVMRRNGRLHVGHGGGQAGTATSLDIIPDEKVVVAILTNLEGSGPKQIAELVLDALLAPAKGRK